MLDSPASKNRAFRSIQAFGVLASRGSWVIIGGRDVAWVRGYSIKQHRRRHSGPVN